MIERFAGRFALLQHLGRGGMGDVYLARDLSTGGECALKRLHRGAGETAHLEAEFRLLMRVSHPAVVRVFELGFSPDGRPFFTMEYVPGLPADRAIRPDDRAAFALAAVQLALGLEALHAAGIVHGDLKPSNLLVLPGPDPSGPPAGVRLLDFGLAHLQQDPTMRHSGTPGFAAPELARGEPPSIATDLYGLGATLYTLASGRRPFESSSATGALRLQSQGLPPTGPLDESGHSQALKVLILRLMSPAPAERGVSAAEIRHELERIFPSAIRPLAERIGAGRIVGRERELAQLETWLAEPDSSVRLEIVVGEAGVGASALLDELAARVEMRRRRVIRLTGAGAAPHVLLRRLIADAGAAGIEIPERSAGIRQWLASDDAMIREEDLTELIAIVAACLRSESEASATLVLVDDSAALDSTSRAFLRRLALAQPESGGIRRMVWTRRGSRESLADDERSLRDVGIAECLELRPLGRDDVARLASARLGAAAPATLVEWLWKSAGGHPGFTIELMRHAADAGAIADDEVGLRVSASALESLAAPPTLEAALIARWEALDPASRAMMAALAVCGRAVSLEELVAIESRADAEVMNRLVAEGLAAHEEDGALALRPPSLGPALLARLDDAPRRALHEAALRLPRLSAAERFDHLRALGREGEALTAAEAAFAEHPDEPLALAAAALCERTSPAQAARWYERVGRLLISRGRHGDAVPPLERALELDPSAEERHERRERLAFALLRSGALARLEKLIPAALADHPPALQYAQHLGMMATAHLQHGRIEEAEAVGRQALDAGLGAGNDLETGIARMSLASTLNLLDRFDEARSMAMSAIEDYERAGNSRGVLRTEAVLATIDLSAGQIADAERKLARGLEAARGLGERQVTQEYLHLILDPAILLGRWGESIAYIDEALRLVIEDGRYLNAAFLMETRSILESLTGRGRAALFHARASIRMSRTAGPWRRAGALRALAHAHGVLGHLRRAERSIRRAISISADLTNRSYARWELANVLLDSGRYADARAVLRPEEEHTPITEPHFAVLAMACARAALRLGELAVAERLLEAAEEWRANRPLPWYAAQAAQLRAELALASGRFADGAAAAREALDGFDALPAPPERARAALEFARLSGNEESDDRVPVSRWLEEAAAGFQRLGDRRGREAALALLVRRLKRMRATAGPGRAQDLITAVRRLLDSLSDLRELAQRSMQLAVEQLDAERGVLLLLDENTGRLVERAEHGAVDAETRRSAATYSRRVVERVAESGGVVLMGDAGSDPRGVSDSILDLRLQSILCVPMYIAGRVVGAVYLDSRQPDAFSEADRGLLEGFAQLMAVAFEKSRGQQEVERVNRQLVGENIQLRVQAGVRFRTQNLVAVSSEMQRVLAVVERVAHSDATVLLTGENGTGKELIALTLHHAGKRHERPFVAVNCGAIPAGLLESELFGILPRVATDVAAREGRFVQANGGTLFLDEITEMPPQQQVALLRVLSSREVTPVGGGTAMPIDVRVIAASNRDIVRMVESGGFREDLYHRLNVIPIEIPPLRERKADIPALAEHFARQFAEQQQRPVPVLSPELLAALMQSDWSGNVRALQNYIERIMAMSSEPVLFPRPLPRDLAGAPAARLHGRKLEAQVEELEQRAINEALKRAGGNQSEAARQLGLTEQSMRYRLRKYAMAAARRKSRTRR